MSKRSPSWGEPADVRRACSSISERFWSQSIEKICPDGGHVVVGVGRDANDPRGKSYEFYTRRPLTDDELRAIHDYLREWRP